MKTTILTLCFVMALVLLSFESGFAFTTQVPEPGTLSLLGIALAGVVGMGAFFKRKK